MQYSDSFHCFCILQLTTLATAFYMMLSKHFENAEFLRQVRMIGFLAQFESLLSSVGKLYSGNEWYLKFIKQFCHYPGDESGMLEDMHVVISELASVSFQVREKKKIKTCFRPGSNRGPCACEAHVITTTLRKHP